MIENVIKEYLSQLSVEMKVQKEDLRIIINPAEVELKIHLYHKAELIKKLSIDEIIG